LNGKVVHRFDNIVRWFGEESRSNLNGHKFSALLQDPRTSTDGIPHPNITYTLQLFQLSHDSTLTLLHEWTKIPFMMVIHFGPTWLITYADPDIGVAGATPDRENQGMVFVYHVASGRLHHQWRMTQSTTSQFWGAGTTLLTMLPSITEWLCDALPSSLQLDDLLPLVIAYII
jgi:hypothetical protein